MGSAASKGAQRIAQRQTSAPSSSSAASQASTKSASSRHETIKIPTTYQVNSSTPAPNSGIRTSPTEWNDLLKRVSGVITTNSWDVVEEIPVPPSIKSMQRHAAQRSEELSAKLPTRRTTAVVSPTPPTAKKKELKAEIGGFLRAEDVLDVFRDRRKKPDVWNAKKIADKYNLNLDDVTNLLKYTRPYLARMDQDGVLRAYYNPDRIHTIKRFESY